jgi:hypothetical protein
MAYSGHAGYTDPIRGVAGSNFAELLGATAQVISSYRYYVLRGANVNALKITAIMLA